MWFEFLKNPELYRTIFNTKKLIAVEGTTCDLRSGAYSENVSREGLRESII